MFDRTNCMKVGLDILYYTGAYKVISPLYKGCGISFMLHHIKPIDVINDEFNPNGGLTITPEFLDQTIKQLKESNVDLVSIDEAIDRITGKSKGNYFACFTIDDGYLDNYQYAWPVFKKHDCPFSIFVTTDIAEGKAVLWCVILEEIISENHYIEIDVLGDTYRLDTSNVEAKKVAFNTIYWLVRNLPEKQQRSLIAEFASKYDYDIISPCSQNSLDWQKIKELSDDPLVTIGAHTISHYALSKLDSEEALLEIKQSRDIIADKIGQVPQFFCYPYGDSGSAGEREFELAREIGFKAAFTTRKGVLFPEYKDRLWSLPRIALNGDFQKERYNELYLSGAPLALLNRFSKMRATR